MKSLESAFAFIVNMPTSIRDEFSPATALAKPFYGSVVFHTPASVIMSLTGLLFTISESIVIFMGLLISGKDLNFNHSTGNLNQTALKVKLFLKHFSDIYKLFLFL